MAVVALEGPDSTRTLEEVGSRIAGRYLLEGVLGRGGTGLVYRARDETLDQPVALKRLQREQLADRPLLATYFKREYHTLKQLAHPCIIHAHDFGLDELGPYYTMELLSGSDLSKLAPMPWKRVCEVLRDVASALALVHSRQLLHRDVSPRNVRLTADGKAKLIDFGALVSMGITCEVIGTPPFIPPEAVNGQGLDARADLYALGALAYYLLTGRHAYPARCVKALRDIWRSRPTPIGALVRDLPREFEGLLASLLSLDPLARPVSASELIERLLAIGELPPGDALAAARCYLSTPSLTGRSADLLRFRKLTLRATRGRGGATLITGPAGSGRTRLLQAVELEGRLAGASVLQASGATAPAGHCGTMHALAMALFELLPELALEEAQADKAVLGHVSPELHARLGHCELARVALPQELPGMLQRALYEWLLRVCERRSLVIEVDDAEYVDEGSLRALSAMAQRARTTRLLLVVAAANDVPPLAPDALAALRRASTPCELAPLTQEQCENLVRSVFGAAPNWKPVAEWVGQLSEGSPRSCMELMQHMLDRGVVRYERGGFILPTSLREHELPRSVGDALDRCIAGLAAEPRELAQVLSLSETPLTLPEYATALGLPGERAEQAFFAIDALVAARVLVTDKQGYRFRLHAHVNAARRSIAPADPRPLHLRLAQIFGLRGDPQRQAAHQLNAGEELPALQTMLAYLERTGPVIGLATSPLFARRATERNEDTTEAVLIRKRLLEICERRHRPARESFMIRGGLLFLANFYDMSLMRGYAEQQIEQLRVHSGALYWHETDPALPAAERVSRCVARAEERYAATPEVDRVLTPRNAIGALLMNVGIAQSYGRQGYVLPLLRDVVQLSGVFRDVSPFHRSSHNATRHSLELVVGRHDRAAELRKEMLAHYDGLLASGQAVGAISLVGYALTLQHEGLYRCLRGGDAAFDYAQRLDDSGDWPWFGPGKTLTGTYSNHVMERRALEIRRLAHLWNGDAEKARACVEPIERMTMQHAFSPYGGGVAFLEAQAYAHSGDLMGLKQSLEAIATIVEQQYPGWAPFLYTARGDYHRLRGELEPALADYDRALAQAAAGTHAAFAPAAAGRAEALHDHGQTRAAHEFARAALEQAERAELGATATLDLQRVLALAEAGVGEHAAGAARLQLLIEEEQRRQLAGLGLGVLYEARARVALHAGDAAGFEAFAQRTAAQYRPGRNPALIAKYERLTEYARSRSFQLTSELLGAAVLHSVEVDTERSTNAAHKGGITSSGGYRSRRALRILVKETGAQGGLLYTVHHGAGLELCAAIGVDAPPPELESALQAYLQAELEDSSEATVTCFDRPSENAPSSLIARCRPLVLTRTVDGQSQIVGVAALISPEEVALASEHTLISISELLTTR